MDKITYFRNLIQYKRYKGKDKFFAISIYTCYGIKAARIRYFKKETPSILQLCSPFYSKRYIEIKEKELNVEKIEKYIEKLDKKNIEVNRI